MKLPETPSNIDLIDILKEPTEPKNEGLKQSDFLNASKNVASDNVATEIKAAINADDFELPPPPPPDQPPIEPQKPSKPRLSESEYEEQAEMSIALFDGLQTLTLPWLYQKSMFTRKELEQLKALNEKKRQPEVELTEEDLKLEEKYRTYKELCDEVPYKEKEIEMLKSPLAKVFSKYNIQLGPEFMLFTALAYVSVPRYLPLFSKLENLDV
jgi:hypothetical protein